MRFTKISDTEAVIIFSTLPDYCPNTLTIDLTVPDDPEDGKSIDPYVNMYWAHTDLERLPKKRRNR